MVMMMVKTTAMISNNFNIIIPALIKITTITKIIIVIQSNPPIPMSYVNTFWIELIP